MYKNNQKNINELLESDDEFPTDYYEVVDTPAYQNNSRFEPIKFQWIDSNFSKYYCKIQNDDKPSLNALYSSLNENAVYRKTENLRSGERILIFNGVLSQNDVFCLKNIESLTSDATLLWFINFLIHKDLQAKFTFLRACLVDTVYNNSSNTNCGSNCDIECKKFNFEII